MKTILLIGATGLVGSSVLQRALAHPDIEKVVALTRRPLSPHDKLNNVIVDFNNLPTDAPWWQVNAIICTLGTTIKTAGSKQNFRKVDFDYPYQVGKIAVMHNVPAYVLNSSIGANADSKVFYSKTKGEIEKALIKLNFLSLTIVRPSIIEGERSESRPMEKVSIALAKLFSPLIPARYKPVHADKIAHCLLESALIAMHGVNIIESDEINNLSRE